MKILQLVPVILFPLLILNGCSKEPTQVRVYNLSAEKIIITIKPATGTIRTIEAVAGETTQYIEIDPTNGGTISGTRTGSGKNPSDINYYTLAESNYGITFSLGDNPTLTWHKE